MKAQERFARMYEAEFASVYRAAYVVCQDRSLAEDIAQEAFVRALERWSRLDGKPWVRGWVITTAMNLARRRRRQIDPDRSGPTRDIDLSIDLQRAISALPRRQREVIILHYLADLSVSDVALAIGRREGTVKAHLSRGREKLRRHMEGASDVRG